LQRGQIAGALVAVLGFHGSVELLLPLLAQVGGDFLVLFKGRRLGKFLLDSFFNFSQSLQQGAQQPVAPRHTSLALAGPTGEFAQPRRLAFAHGHDAVAGTVELHAARADGVEQPSRLGGEQQEERALGWFLERF